MEWLQRAPERIKRARMGRFRLSFQDEARLYLPYTSPISPLYLPHISPIPPRGSSAAAHCWKPLLSVRLPE